MAVTCTRQLEGRSRDPTFHTNRTESRFKTFSAAANESLKADEQRLHMSLENILPKNVFKGKNEGPLRQAHTYLVNVLSFSIKRTTFIFDHHDCPTCDMSHPSSILLLDSLESCCCLSVVDGQLNGGLT